LPFYWFLNLSFQPRIDIFTIPPYLYPLHFTIHNYLEAFGRVPATEASGGPSGNVARFQMGVINSFVLANVVTVLTLAICILMSYAFARYRFQYKTLIFVMILAARTFPPIVTSIPYYQFYKWLNLLGTWPGIILADLTVTLPLTTWILTGFFSSLPRELDNQARVDGCSRLQAFLKVLIPVAAPGIAAVAVLTWLETWNEFVYSFLLGSVKGLYFAAAELAAPLYGGSYEVELFVAFVGVYIIPAIITAIILQKYITRLKIVGSITIENLR
jgi:multiple sugar transport system permease protein